MTEIITQTRAEQEYYEEILPILTRQLAMEDADFPMSFRDCGKALGVAPSYVHYCIEKFRRLLREELKKDE